jgi:glycosyltransferase involved in cell wall biosynthesis
VLLHEPGVIVAMNRGCACATGDVISLTDDDAVPHADWLAKIEAVFASDAGIGAVGGMDILRSGGDIPTSFTQQVGIITAYGRVLGNHHRGCGPLRPVEHLKGVNMSWRATAAGPQPFITDLRGNGAQVFFELTFCFQLARQGWKIVYDPSILVDHFVATRFDQDQRQFRSLAAQEDGAFNFYLALLREHPGGMQRMAALAWARLVGIRDMPGLLRRLLIAWRGDARSRATAAATRRAWVDALRHARATKRP